jgi:alanine dehydrogenase
MEVNMNNVGIVKGDVCSTSAMPSPEDVKAISKFMDVYIQSDAGMECGYSDNEYALEGCFIRDNSEDVIASADLILFQNPIGVPFQPKEKKIVIANIDAFKDLNQLKLFMHENVDLYTFDAINDGTGDFKDKFVNFIRFHLGDPIQSKYISLFARSKILKAGKIVHKDLL